MIFDRLVDFINGAQVEGAAYKPTKPYTGNLPTKTVKKGSKGTDVKRVQHFLKWCMKADLKVDGDYGAKTVKAVLKHEGAV